jgi:putative phosphoribosyl transferase
MQFKNRDDAGKLLAKKLIHFKDTNSIVLAIPRGGVPVGAIIADKLNLPLEIELSKKIGHPINPEYAIGSVTLHGVTIDKQIKDVSEEYIQEKSKKIQHELHKKFILFMGDRTQLDVKGKIVILVDDGIATGNTLIACIHTIKKRKPKKIVVAIPVSPKNTALIIEELVDEFICLQIPPNFHSVGQFYEDFTQVSNENVSKLLAGKQLENIY